MSEVQNGVKIGNATDPARITARLARVRDALKRAEGDRKASLQAEESQLLAQVEQIKAQIAGL